MADEGHPSTTTIPSTDLSSSHSPRKDAPPRPSDATLLAQLRFLVRRSLASTDRNLIRFSKLLSTPSGTDVLLCTTSYTLTLVRALLSRHLAARLALKDPSNIPSPHIVSTITASKALADIIADYRIFVRLWGLLGLYTWARSTYLTPLPATAPRKDRVQRKITWAAIAACVGFQALENGAYLSSKGVLTSVGWAGEAGKRRETAWWVWSSRFWAAYVALELLRLGVARLWPGQVEAVADADGEKDEKIAREAEVARRNEENFVWWKDLTSNIAYAPMTLHWSFEEGLLSDAVVGACGTVAGGAMLVDAWRKTA